MNKKRLLAILAMVFTAMVWGITFEMVSDALKVAPPFMFGAYRFGLAFILGFIYYIFILNKKIDKTTIVEFRGGLICGIVLCAGYAFQNFGLWDNSIYLGSEPSHSAFITSISVILVPSFLYLFNIQKINYKLWGVVLLAIIGIFILLNPIKDGIRGGDIVTFGCAVSFAVHIILQDIYLKKRVNVLRFFMLQVFFVSAFSLICSFGIQEQKILFSYEVIIALLVTGAIATFIGFILMLWAQKILSATETGITLSLEPLFAALYSVYIGNALGLQGWIGGLIIIIAIIGAVLLPLKSSKK